MNSSKFDFEINLLPIISLLAVLISFLLLTAVWVPIGGIGAKQSVGDQEAFSKQESLSIWVQFNANNSVSIILKDNSMKSIGGGKNLNISTKAGLKGTEKWIDGLMKAYPDIDNAIIAPHSHTSVNDIVRVMDQIKNLDGINVGIAPI